MKTKIKPGDARILSYMSKWIPDIKAMEATAKILKERKKGKKK